MEVGVTPEGGVAAAMETVGLPVAVLESRVGMVAGQLCD